MNAIPAPDDRLSRTILVIAGLMGGLAVLIGAFGAHGLDGYLIETGLTPELVAKRLSQFDVGARYHLIHAVALLALVNLTMISSRSRMIVSALLTVGIVVFSGSLYALVLTNRPWLGAITPIGGAAWIMAWFTLAVSGMTARR